MSFQKGSKFIQKGYVSKNFGSDVKKKVARLVEKSAYIRYSGTYYGFTLGITEDFWKVRLVIAQGGGARQTFLKNDEFTLDTMDFRKKKFTLGKIGKFGPDPFLKV